MITNKNKNNNYILRNCKIFHFSSVKIWCFNFLSAYIVHFSVNGFHPLNITFLIQKMYNVTSYLVWKQSWVITMKIRLQAKVIFSLHFQSYIKWRKKITNPMLKILYFYMVVKRYLCFIYFYKVLKLFFISHNLSSCSLYD